MRLLERSLGGVGSRFIGKSITARWIIIKLTAHEIKSYITWRAVYAEEELEEELVWVSEKLNCFYCHGPHYT